MEAESGMIAVSTLLFLALALGGGVHTGPNGVPTGPKTGAHGAAPGPLPGWEMSSHSARHTASDLHKYLNGGAARYLAYSIQELHVQEYARRSDGFTVTLELYRMDSPENAFGVYSSDRGGLHPNDIGEEASYGGGLLQFWQGRYYVRVQAGDPAGDPSGPVIALGRAVSKALLSWDAGPFHPPALVVCMPPEGLITDSLCFFHTQVSLNSIYYISEKNILNLSLETDAVTAEYSAPGGGTARVIAVCYPDTASARKAYDAAGSSGAQGLPPGTGIPEAFSALDGRLLVLVVDAPTRSEATALGSAVLAAARRAAACNGRQRGEPDGDAD